MIETFRDAHPATCFEPRWDVSDQDVQSLFGGLATSVTIDYEKEDDVDNAS